MAFALRAFSFRLREVDAACRARAAARAGDSSKSDPRVGDPHLEEAWGEARVRFAGAGEGLLGEAREPPAAASDGGQQRDWTGVAGRGWLRPQKVGRIQGVGWHPAWRPPGPKRKHGLFSKGGLVSRVPFS